MYPDYFRWRLFKEHTAVFDDLQVITEFWPGTRHIPGSADPGTIPCASGHHIAEGIWLRDVTTIDE